MSLNHPPKNQLIAFGQGKLAGDESSSVEQHLELCRECCETLLDLKDDTFVGLVKIAPPSDAVADAASVRTDPGADASCVGHDSAHAATILVQSGESVSVDELPIELQDHPRYRIVELIGRGGMGNVYRAEHRLMNQPVAIKLINSQLIRQPNAVERFRREVQAAAKLTHPNIVTAYDAEQAGDVHFLVMEFVEGTDLASVVKHRGPMSVTEACDCIRQAAEGLQHAHEKGMVHRDIKPHNLMLSAEGLVRILDFGLAGFVTEATADTISRNALASGSEAENADPDKPDASAFRLMTAAHLTTAGSVMGTPDYIAPEQAKDAHSADIRADIYSLGCTLHFLLTGKPPFEADHVLAKLKAHAQETPPALAALRKDVPIELERVASRMLAKDPAERFQTPAEVVAALLPFTKTTTARQQRTRRLIAAALLGFMTLLAGVLVMVSNRGRLEIQSEVEDVKVRVTKGGEQVEVFDLKTGSQMKWLPGGEYELQVVGKDNDVKLDKTGFTISRFGQVIVTANWNATGRGVVRAFSSTDKPITQDGVVVDDGGWKVTASENRTVRLFEIPDPQLDVGPFFFRAKLRTENVNGRAYLEMWNRFPGKGEFFSKGIQHAVSGTTGWAEYEIPFNLKKGEQPELVKLNVTIEGVGSVWIKDIELRGRTIGRSADGATQTPFDPTSLGAAEREALKAAEAFLAVADEGNFGKLYDLGSNLAKKQARREQVVPLYQQIRDTAGKVEKRTLQRVRLIDEFLGLPPGRYAAVQYVSDFEKHKGLWETVMLNVDDDGQWRANTYAATVQPLPLPEPKKAPTKGVSSTSTNLLTDPSFENTGLTQLPSGWRAWLNDGPEFRCEVVAGGHTGQRCLRISGKGTRGVVFGNDLKADRSKRYALKGWAKFEGDKDARAVIKFNYFRGSEFLGVHDLVGATADQPGWQLFEKTDALDVYPQADHFYAMCHVEGNGTGWFDDLELVAYDRDKLPNDFDARHGRHNRLHGPNSLNRWVGTWDTEYVFRETDNSPKETKLKMTTISERTLGNYFLMSHAVADADSISKPTLAASATNAAALGAEERLLFLTFDQNIGAFRQWFFSGNGKVFEWRGPWNQETQSLELRMLPDASNLHSTEHFVDAEHIEAKLRFQYVMGMKDAGRWTATRQAADGKVDVPAAKTHAAEPTELSQLNKFAGEWTIHATYKPSVWNPQPREETIRETSVWILGGRFLMTRAFNEKDELTSIWIATYEPRDKSNHFWFFNADGSNGEWRLTWDEPSSGFHFRAVDMPTGWSGTGFNRWVDENSFDNSAMIKDETGRVMLDMTQDKRRKKP